MQTLTKTQELMKENGKTKTDVYAIKGKTNSMFEVYVMKAIQSGCTSKEDVAKFLRLAPEKLAKALPQSSMLFTFNGRKFELCM